MTKNGIKILPLVAQKELNEAYLTKKDRESNETKIEVYPDPLVQGTYAVQITRYTQKLKRPRVVQLLWYSGEFDEVEFESWPPTIGRSQFFI